MSYLIKPKNYKPLLDLKQTELGIKQIKEFFQLNLSSELRLRRVIIDLMVIGNKHLDSQKFRQARLKFSGSLPHLPPLTHFEKMTRMGLQSFYVP